MDIDWVNIFVIFFVFVTAVHRLFTHGLIFKRFCWLGCFVNFCCLPGFIAMIFIALCWRYQGYFYRWYLLGLVIWSPIEPFLVRFHCWCIKWCSRLIGQSSIRAEGFFSGQNRLETACACLSGLVWYRLIELKVWALREVGVQEELELSWLFMCFRNSPLFVGVRWIKNATNKGFSIGFRIRMIRIMICELAVSFLYRIWNIGWSF